MWDECFEFAVSLESCRSAQAALSLSVWDRDVLTADDFAGEAFVSLARVPGVNSHAPPDPLRPLELPLMQLHDRSKWCCVNAPNRLAYTPNHQPAVNITCRQTLKSYRYAAARSKLVQLQPYRSSNFFSQMSTPKHSIRTSTVS